MIRWLVPSIGGDWAHARFFAANFASMLGSRLDVVRMGGSGTSGLLMLFCDWNEPSGIGVKRLPAAAVGVKALRTLGMTTQYLGLVRFYFASSEHRLVCLGVSRANPAVRNARKTGLSVISLLRPPCDSPSSMVCIVEPIRTTPRRDGGPNAFAAIKKLPS